MSEGKAKIEQLEKEIIMIKSQPWLGNATTGELFGELQARAGFRTCDNINCKLCGLDYKTVGPHCRPARPAPMRKKVSGTRFEYAQALLNLVASAGLGRESLVGEMVDLCYLEDRECEELSETTPFEYEYLRTLFPKGP